jgi:hypothetical protein
MAVHQALLFRQLSADVTLFLHTAPEPSGEQREQLAARRIAVVDGEVAALQVTGDHLTGVQLRSGEVYPRQAVVVAPRFTARADVFTSLGLEPIEQQVDGHVIGSYVAADPTGATAIPGVWVAGNVADLRAQVISAAAAGLNTAAVINADLVAEDARQAVAVQRDLSLSAASVSAASVSAASVSAVPSSASPFSASSASPVSADGLSVDGFSVDGFSVDAEREVCERVLGDRRHGV